MKNKKNEDKLVRVVKIRLTHATEQKQRAIKALLEAYQGAVNFYIRSLWVERGKMDAATLARLQNTRLSERYKSQALKQALEIVVGTKKSILAINKTRKKKRRIKQVPRFAGVAILDSKFVVLEEARSKEFDYWLKLSTLKKGRRIPLPITATPVLNKWLATPLAKLKRGCGLGIDPDGTPFALLYVEVPKLPIRQEGKRVGCDIGQNKLITLSDRSVYGLEMRGLLDKIDRREKGSRGRLRAYRERDNYLGYVLNQIPYEELSLLVAEDLRGIKHGKSKKRSRKFRRKSAAWTAARLLDGLERKCEENRVLFAKVPPAYTSQTCPKCNHVAEENRKGEAFGCVGCGYTDDADVVGALNVLSRYLGSLESPTPPASVSTFA